MVAWARLGLDCGFDLGRPDRVGPGPGILGVFKEQGREAGRHPHWATLVIGNLLATSFHPSL